MYTKYLWLLSKKIYHHIDRQNWQFWHWWKKQMKCILCALQVILFEEAGQVDDEVLAKIDIILRKVLNINIYMGELLIIFSMDHTQIQPILGRPFLTSFHIIPCFKIVSLENTVWAYDDDAFQRIQKVGRLNHKMFDNEPELVDDFLQLRPENFMFVDLW